MRIEKMNNARRLGMIFEMLKHTVSKDETRPALTGVYHDGINSTAVSTNGFALTASTAYYCHELSGKTISPKWLNTVNREFIKYQSIVPVENKCKKMSVMLKKEWATYRDAKKRTVIYFLEDGTTSLELKEGYVFALDVQLIKPLLKDIEVDLFYQGELTPTKIDLLNGNYVVVMPTRP